MSDWLTHSWDSVTQFFSSLPYQGMAVWTLTGCLLLVGLLGTVLPLLPGPLIIFAAGIVHTLLLPEAGMSWQGVVILTIWLVISYVIDFLSGAVGARWFGASRWGIAGVFLGGIVGLFFGPLGIILGPVVGGLAFELIFAKKSLQPAVKSTWGSVLGTGVGLVLRFVVSMAMVATILIDCLWW